MLHKLYILHRPRNRIPAAPPFCTIKKTARSLSGLQFYMSFISRSLPSFTETSAVQPGRTSLLTPYW